MKKFKIVKETEEYADGKRFSIVRAKLKTPGDKEVNWSYVKGRDGVIVIALDNENSIYIKKEWRLARKGFLWELPSGYIEKEKPSIKDIKDAANRELQEEIGLKANSLKILSSFFIMNHSTSKFHIILATELKESSLDKDEHEIIQTEKISVDEAYNKLVNKQIPNAQIIIALSLLKEHLNKNQ
jgi:8-oxo-dGTP pyrophosphatase MutT (NUDIX family)